MPLTKSIHVIRAWFDDHIFLRLIKNAGWLSGATFISGLLGLITIALTARALGPAEFGALTVIMAYVAIIDRLLNFQSWQFLIRNGAEALQQNDPVRLRRQIKFSILLDSISSLLSTLVAIAIASVVASLIDWTEQETGLAMLYSLTILFHLSGMPTGVLRLFDQYRRLATQKVITAVLNLLGVLVAWGLDGGLPAFLLAFAISSIAGNVILFVMGWWQLRTQKISGVWSTSLQGIRGSESGIWHFVIYTNIESSVKIIRDLDAFIIKAFLTAEAVGLYLLARRIAEALHMLVDPFSQAVYPEFTRLLARRHLPPLKTLIKKSSLTVGLTATLIWLGFIVIGPWLVPLVFGDDYAPAYLLAAICMAGSVLWAYFQPVTPILYGLGKAKDVFHIHISTAVLYVLLVTVFAVALDGLGAAIAYAGFFLAWSILASAVMRHRLHSHTWEA